MKSILKTHLYDQFLIDIDTTLTHTMSFKIYEVNSWDLNNEPLDLELYMTGTIKQDGCSHVWFGDYDENNKQDGYLHLCGKHHWELHCKLMMSIYELAEQTIPNLKENEQNENL